MWLKYWKSPPLSKRCRTCNYSSCFFPFPLPLPPPHSQKGNLCSVSLQPANLPPVPEHCTHPVHGWFIGVLSPQNCSRRALTQSFIFYLKCFTGCFWQDDSQALPLTRAQGSAWSSSHCGWWTTMVLVEAAPLLPRGQVWIWAPSLQMRGVSSSDCQTLEWRREVALHCQREILNFSMALNSKTASGSPEQWDWTALWSFEHWHHDKFPENSCKIFFSWCILSRWWRNGFVKWWIGCFMDSNCAVNS